MAALAAAVAGALRARGVADAAADLAAQSGVTVFGVAFEQWIAEGEDAVVPRRSSARCWVIWGR